MESVPKPRCARGRDCYHVRELHSDKPPTVGRKGDLCEKCIQEGHTPEDAPSGRANSIADGKGVKRTGARNRQDPPATERLRRFKGDLVVEMVTERGEFWKEVQKARKRWGITPITRIPPEVPSLPYPPNEPDEGIERPYFRYSWYRDLCILRDLVVPEAYRYPGPHFYWIKFLSACLLYDPPDDDLEGFAEYAGPDPDTIATEQNSSENGADTGSDMSVLPIKYLIDPSRAQTDMRWFYESVIDNMGELLQQKLEQAGITPEQFSIDIWELYREVTVLRSDREDKYWDKARNLSVAHVARQCENWPHPFIDPLSEEATKDNVVAARRLIRQTHPSASKDGRPKIDPLVAVQCAILYYRHNYRMPEDRRRQRWTKKTLAEEFNLRSEKAAKDHIKLGLEKMPQLRENK